MKILNRYSNAVIFEYDECKTIKELVEKAIKQGANLHGANLQGANLQDADLRGASLHGANLQDASLQYASLQDANLQGANLQGADLQDADLQDADLRGASLQGANLQDADLRGANLHVANLQDANLRDANLQHASLQDANLRDANLQHAVSLHLYSIVPEIGQFNAFKKINNHLIVLQIPENAERLNAYSTRKCRVSEALVLSITNIASNIEVQTLQGGHDRTFIYTVGKTIVPDKYDNDKRTVCTNGIHCFITRQEAIDY